MPRIIDIFSFERYCLLNQQRLNGSWQLNQCTSSDPNEAERKQHMDHTAIVAALLSLRPAALHTNGGANVSHSSIFSYVWVGLIFLA